MEAANELKNAVKLREEAEEILEHESDKELREMAQLELDELSERNSGGGKPGEDVVDSGRSGRFQERYFGNTCGNGGRRSLHFCGRFIPYVHEILRD